MNSDPSELVSLVSVQNEMEAAIIVNALADAGIRAMATGGFTSGFKAEAPGVIEIRVMRSDVENARQRLAERKDDYSGEWQDDV